MRVVCLHPDNGDAAFVDCVEDMPFEVEVLMSYQRARAWEARSLASEDNYLDPWGGASQDDWDFDRQLQQEQGFLDELAACLGEVPPSLGTPPFTMPPVATTAVGAAASSSSSVPLAPTSARASSSTAMPIAALVEQAAPQEGSQQSQAGSVVGGADSGAASNVCASALEKCRRRRLLPRAMTTGSDFKSLFDRLHVSADRSTSGVESDVAERRNSILQKTANMRRLVQQSYPAWPDDLTVLATGALAVYRMRMIDMFMREHVLLLYIMEGSRYMRVHRGVAYFYHEDGAFQPFKGVPPEATFGRVKEYLLRLEGLFRLLPAGVRREDDTLLAAIDRCVRQSAGVNEYLKHCVDAAIFQVGGQARRNRRRDAGSARAAVDALHDVLEEPEADPEADMVEEWPCHTAKALSRVGLLIQRELLGEQLISYVIEWCETECMRVPGCCYHDTSVLYDRALGQHVTHTTRSPDNHIYVRIPHTLLRPSLRDPVLATAAERLETFYAQTFWCNCDVFLCCQAAQALAKRGENVDRCFIGVSPGFELRWCHAICVNPQWPCAWR